ncbi:hypothetical protein SAMN05518672_106194 [Chitinophaga sp. CF118]|nr:hypothetical protein SAMN05518672_106194 [Chitinophaga sp. CF118]
MLIIAMHFTDVISWKADMKLTPEMYLILRYKIYKTNKKICKNLKFIYILFTMARIKSPLGIPSKGEMLQSKLFSNNTSIKQL